MNDWDAVSSPADEDAAWNAVSTPASQKKSRAHGAAPALKRTVLFLGVFLLLVLSGGGVFWGVHTHAIHFPVIAASSSATTKTAQPTATATANTEQQLYAQVTSGTPSISDPLTDDRNSWGVFTTSWGGQCAFTGGAYHISLSNPGFLIECTGGPIANLTSNFVMQVQFTIQQGNEAAIVFGDNHRINAYRIDINSTGAYTLYEYTTANGWPILQNGSNSAIKTGLNQVNVATIVMNNNNFYFFMNGQSVINTYLGGYIQGGAELAAQSDNQPTDVAFSNLKIWTLS